MSLAEELGSRYAEGSGALGLERERGAVPNQTRQDNVTTTNQKDIETRREEYIRRVEASTQQITDRMRRTERLTEEHFAFRVNTTQS